MENGARQDSLVVFFLLAEDDDFLEDKEEDLDLTAEEDVFLWIGASFCCSWIFFLSKCGEDRMLEDEDEEHDGDFCRSILGSGSPRLDDDPGRLVPSRSPCPEKAWERSRDPGAE